VTLIAAGLLNYANNASAADPSASIEPDPTLVASGPDPSIPLPTLPAISTPGASQSTEPSLVPSPNPNRVATRIVIDAMGIDLPVVKPRGGSNVYPLCNVAMYLQDPRIGQPGSGHASYIYAHARDGMFGPIYERAIQKKHGGPQSMVGMLVRVYTSDDLMFEYEISKVYLHQLSLDAPLSATSEQLWLQTSEGPHGTPGKTQILAQPVIVLQADHQDAHPTPHPVVCG
jgi:hypothetical protein